MSRKASDNDFQVSFKIPTAWVSKADHYANSFSRKTGVMMTRTDVLRLVMRKGFFLLANESDK